VKKKSIWIAIGLVLLVLVSWFLLKGGKPEEGGRGPGRGPGKGKKDAPRLVEALVLRPQSLQNELSVTGSLLAFDEVELKNDVAGRIVFLNLPEGKNVKKGTVLVRLYNDDLQAGLRKLEAQLSLQVQLSKRQYELREMNGISQNEYEKTVLEVSTLKAEIEEKKAQIRKTEVLAPFDGIVGLRNVSVGAVVTTSTVLATLRSSKLKLDFYVPEKYSEVIRPGMQVAFSLYSGQKELQAVVQATERGIDTDTRNLKVRAFIQSSATNLNPGAFANVKLRLGDNQKALMVPNECLIPMERNQQVILSRNGKAVFVTVKTGIRKESKVEILEGLQPGDTIVTSGMMFIKAEDPLKFSHVIDAL
jgi:membrane fusion protein, multidrug efflux system